MPRIGKIHLGFKAKNAAGTEYPKAVDHFVCPDDLCEAMDGKVPFCDGKACKTDTGPTELPVMFVTDDIDVALDTYYRAYKGSSGLVCKGDGYNADALLDMDEVSGRDGDVTQPLPLNVWASSKSKRTSRVKVKCLGAGYDDEPPCPLFEAKGCKKLMMPQFAILDAPGLGVYQVDTSSVFGIENLHGFLTYLSGITGGRISGIPLVLKVVPQEVSPDGKKKTVHVLQLEAAFSMMDLQKHLDRPGMTYLLPAADEEVPGDFFPAEVVETNGKAAEPTPDEPPPKPAPSPKQAPKAAAQPETNGGPHAAKARYDLTKALDARFKGDEQAVFEYVQGKFPEACEGTNVNYSKIPEAICAELIEQLPALAKQGELV
jgi:hypothetical protein